MINVCISHVILTLIRYFLIPKSRDLVSHNPGISGLKNGPGSRDSGSRDCNPYGLIQNFTMIILYLFLTPHQADRLTDTTSVKRCIQEHAFTHLTVQIHPPAKEKYSLRRCQFWLDWLIEEGLTSHQTHYRSGGLWHMRRHGPVTVQCTDSVVFPLFRPWPRFPPGSTHHAYVEVQKLGDIYS